VNIRAQAIYSLKIKQ